MTHAWTRRLVELADGTVQQESPLTGTVVWTVPGRSNRPLPAPFPASEPLATTGRDSTCAFCPARYWETPPEKARLVLATPGARPWRIERHIPADRLNDSVADFRRIPNLFEILGLDYWRANHGVTVSGSVATTVRDYLARPEGQAHVRAIMGTRLRAAGKPADELATVSEENLRAAAMPLFAGTHDVIVARRHHIDNATFDDQLCSAGDLSADEHHAFIAFTVEALADLAAANPHVRTVATFQNWLRPAGASFDHLHKQLVAIDDWGPLTTRILGTLATEPDLFNTAIADPAAHDRLVIAENDHAVALAGVGHRYPTVEIFSTCAENLPWDHDAPALRAVSDVLHACHAATGRLVPTNEEWHFRPPTASAGMPWRVTLKWRISTLAGFEGGTKINLNTISPFTLRDRMVTALTGLRGTGTIAPMRLGDECSHRIGTLQYRRD